jgi:SAM-dependent methyltransferase
MPAKAGIRFFDFCAKLKMSKCFVPDFVGDEYWPSRNKIMGTAIVQGDLWNGNPRYWSDLQEPLFAPMYEAVLDRAAIGVGAKVLDVGCGSGLFLSIAANRGAAVAGVDAAEGLLAIARDRTPRGDFRTGDMEELPFADGAFDLVTGFNSFQFAADPVNALKQAKRVAKPTGKVTMAVWGAAKDCEAAAVVKAMGGMLPPPPPGTPGPFALSEPGVMEGMLSKAGLTPSTAEDVDTPFDFSNEEDAYRAFAASGPGIRAIRLAGKDKLRTALLSALAPFKTKSGSLHLDNKFRFVVARP